METLKSYIENVWIVTNWYNVANPNLYVQNFELIDVSNILYYNLTRRSLLLTSCIRVDGLCALCRTIVVPFAIRTKSELVAQTKGP